MTATTEDYSPVDNKFAIFSNLDKDLQFLGPSSPAVSTDPEVIVLPPPNSPTPYLSNPAQNDGKESPDSTSTIEASANDPTVEVPPTVGVQLKADNSNEDQYEPPIPSQPMVAPGLSLPSQFKHSAETANSVNSRQHRREHSASRPTAIIRPRINTRLHYGLKPGLRLTGNYL